MKRRNFNRIRFSLILLFTIISYPRLYQGAIASRVLAEIPQTSVSSLSRKPKGSSQTFISENESKIRIRYKQKNSGSDRGRPNKREGMASRNDCPSANIPLTALIPENNVNKVVEKNPTFWLFIPYPASKIPVGEFVLQDKADNDVYRKKFSIEKGEGIVSVSLDNEKALEVNKIYQWYFKLYCNNSKLSNPIYVHGWVQRVPLQPQLQKQLNTIMSSRQRISFYAQNDIWYSALTELAKLRQADPQNQIIAKDWFSLLSDVGLQELSNKPMIGSIKSISKISTINHQSETSKPISN
ncbi:MAG: DUF928 domain-containing protein [Cyanobacteria bacterium P01_A01_bin.84]